jgi:hypothetical protein
MKRSKETMRAWKQRKARAGSTKVVVIEDDGELTAIVVDRYRGIVRIPLGTVDPPLAALPS